MSWITNIDIDRVANIEVLGNTVQNYLVMTCVVIGTYLIFSIGITFAIKKLEKLAAKTETDLDDILIETLGKLKWTIFLIIILIAAPTLLEAGGKIATFSRYAIIIILTYQGVRIAGILIDYATTKATEKADHSSFIKPFGTVAKVAAWIVGGVLILSNLGYDVTSLVAGLGIGGIAIALALQNVLSDIFSSLSIYFDKPFKPGDYIRIDDQEGTVQSIGIKTTRLTSVQGEELVIPNNTLVSSNIQNFGKVKKRRIQFTVGICYETPVEKIKEAKEIITKVIKKTNDTEFDRVFFKTMAESNLKFDIVYFVQSGNYKDYLTVQENMNLEIMKQFEKAGIHFAYPTQTLHIKKS